LVTALCIFLGFWVISEGAIHPSPVGSVCKWATIVALIGFCVALIYVLFWRDIVRVYKALESSRVGYAFIYGITVAFILGGGGVLIAFDSQRHGLWKYGGVLAACIIFCVTAIITFINVPKP
jgi:hypothetical protein